MLKRTPLYKQHEELTGILGPYHGWEMPLRFGDPAREHLAVRRNVGLVDLSYLGVLEVSGKEAAQFLNGLVSSNVKTLREGNGIRGAFLTAHGKVKALCRVLDLGTSFLVISDPQTHDSVLAYLTPFSYAGDFKVADISEQFPTISIQGPKSSLVLKEISFEPAPELAEHCFFRTLIAGHEVVVVKASHTGANGFDLLAPVSALPDIWDFVVLKGSFHSIVPFGLEALDSLRVEAGIPVYGEDVDESNMLLEIGLDDAVSFDKGCYTGQEAVAMATYRGHVSKKLSGLLLSGDIVPPNKAIVRKDEKEIGFVTSAIRSPMLDKVIALAYIKYGFFELGNEVRVQMGDLEANGHIVALPFVGKE